MLPSVKLTAAPYQVGAAARAGLDRLVEDVVDGIGVVPEPALHRVGAGLAVEQVGAGIADDEVGQGIAGAAERGGTHQDQVLDIGAEGERDGGLVTKSLPPAALVSIADVAHIVDAVAIVAEFARHRCRPPPAPLSVLAPSLPVKAVGETVAGTVDRIAAGEG